MLRWFLLVNSKGKLQVREQLVLLRFQANRWFLLWISTALCCMPLFLATWAECGEMDYIAFTASRGLISAQQALCVPVTFLCLLIVRTVGLLMVLLLWAPTLTDQFLTQSLCFLAGCYNLEA